jgi:hypothetical protein
MDKKTAELSTKLYTRLQGYGVPFEDTIETVITRLCDYFDLHNRVNPAADTPTDGTEARLNFWSQQLGAALVHDPIQASLHTERVQMEYLELLNNAVKRLRRVKSPYEVEVQDDSHVELFRTSRAVYLPIGVMLLGEYQQHRVGAAITANGIECFGRVYDNPSKAAVDAKMHLGASDKQAQTNGWQFWKIEMPPNSGIWEPLDKLRAAQMRSFENEPI